MMKRFFSLVMTGVVLLSCHAVAEDGMGRASLQRKSGEQSGLGRARLPAPSYDGFHLGGTWGMKIGVGWANADWDIGDASGSERLFVPQGSLFYKTTDNLDVNFSVMFLSPEDEEDDLGKTEGDMTRLALGARYWFNTQSRITPYAGAGLGYYLLDGKTENTRNQAGEIVPANVSVDNAPGAFLEGGLAFQTSDSIFFNADLTYDFLLDDPEVTVNDEEEDFDISSLSLNLGFTFMF